MSDPGYGLAQAASDLGRLGLLSGCLVARDGRWIQVAPGADLGGLGSFLGAGLDSRRLQAGQLFVALAGAHQDGRLFAGQALRAGAAGVLTRAWPEAVGDPLLQLEAPADAGAAVFLCPDPTAALTCLASLWRARQAQVRLVAVTGSNGKTTTKDLIAAIMAQAGPHLATEGNLNNELGVPLTLLRLRGSHAYAVVELGASARGEIARLAATARPEVGVITNAAEAHLAEFGSLEGVIQGKGELLASLPAHGLAVLNADSPGFATWNRRAICPVASFGRSAGRHRWIWLGQERGSGGALELDGCRWQVPLPGEHNGANLVAALLAARAVGIALPQMAAGLAAFRPSAHRGHLVDLGGVMLLDDCYNANPASVQSAAAALCALPGQGSTYAVLGVMAELGAQSGELHRRTGEALARLGLTELLAVGAGAEPLAAGFVSAGGTARHFAGKPEAAAWLAARLVAGDRLLVKGSRIAAMEEIIAELRERLGLASKTE